MPKPLVVLDAMGVIYTARDDVVELLIPFARSFGCQLSDSDISTAYLNCSLGLCTSQELWRTLGARGDLTAVEDRYLTLHRVSPGLLSFLKTMEEERVSVACLSNDVAEWSLKLRRRHQLAGRILTWTISGEVGARKPSAVIYRTLLGRVRRDAEECVFVDDRIANLDAARELGFITVYFSDHSEADNTHGAVRSFGELEQWVRALTI